jgi:hypothetical protein
LFTIVAVSLLVLGLLLFPMMRQQLLRTNTTLAPKVAYLNLAYVASLWPLAISSIWGRFGWMNVLLPFWLTAAFTLFAGLGVLGSTIHVWSRSNPNPSNRKLWIWLWMVCVLVLVGFVRFNLSEFQPQGRLLFPALPAFAILIGMGWCNWCRGKAQTIVCGSLVLSLFAANVFALRWVLLAAYAS